MSDGNHYLQFILKFELLLSFALTTGLIIISILQKDRLTSDRARKLLRKNIRLFWITAGLLFIPIILFVFWEILELFKQSNGKNGFNVLIQELQIIALLFLNTGLLLSYAIYLKIRGKK